VKPPCLRREPRRPQPLAFATLLLLGGALGACASAPEHPEDLDAEPTGAVSMTVGTAVGGSLECADELGPDCRDWYRFQPRQPGQLRVTARSIAPAAEGEEPTEEPRPVQLQLTDSEGTVIGEAEGPEAIVRWRVKEPGALLALVRMVPGEGRIQYELTTTVEEARRTRSLRRPVLEVETGRNGGGAHVLIDGGRDQSLRVGMRGKLVQDGRSIGRIRIVEVFPQGSRAAVEGELTSPVTPETVAEIALPLN
jgi:hypothetical protein